MSRLGTCPRCSEKLRPRDTKYLRHLQREDGQACGQTFRLQYIVEAVAVPDDAAHAEAVKKRKVKA